MKKLFLAATLLSAGTAFSQPNVFPATGNVGIGTTSPQASLDILANGNIPVIRGNGGYIPTGLRFIDDSYTQPGQIQEWSIWKGNTWAKGLAFMRYDAVNRCNGGICDASLFLSDNGTVGVGTQHPQANFHVYNKPSDNPIDAMTIDVGSFGTTANSLNSHYFRVRDIGAGGYVPFIIRGDGAVGIGTENPQAQLHVAAHLDGPTDGGVIIGNTNTPNLRFGNTAQYSWMQSHAGAPLNINPIGNNIILNRDWGMVGIGTDNPQAKLDVNGTAVFDFKAYDHTNIRLGHDANDAIIADNSASKHYGGGYFFRVDNPHTGAYEDAMVVSEKGNIGIGVLNPETKLEVSGTVRLRNLPAGNANTDYLTLDANGNVQVQNAAPGGGGTTVWNDIYTGAPATANTDDMYVMSKLVGIGTKSPTERLEVEGNQKVSGKVGIGGVTTFPTTAGGTNVSGYNLFVKGGILTDEVRVGLNSTWADYVFADNYELKPLSEVESYIEQNKHLPNVPSAAQVKAEGINVGEISRIQQEKIEELTLYIIQQEKRLKALEAKLGSK